jgi:hypothetical protein
MLAVVVFARGKSEVAVVVVVGSFLMVHGGGFGYRLIWYMNNFKGALY